VLLSKGAKVYMATHVQKRKHTYNSRAQAVHRQRPYILHPTGPRTLNSVKSTAEDSSTGAILLIHSTIRVTSQGYDLQFGTNVLGNEIQRELISHYLGVQGIRWPTVIRGDDSLEERKKFGPVKLFGQSKTKTLGEAECVVYEDIDTPNSHGAITSLYAGTAPLREAQWQVAMPTTSHSSLGILYALILSVIPSSVYPHDLRATHY
ncbi:hypothetical protein F5148DRAFT_1155087, partial [Russula earlei]